MAGRLRGLIRPATGPYSGRRVTLRGDPPSACAGAGATARADPRRPPQARPQPRVVLLAVDAPARQQPQRLGRPRARLRVVGDQRQIVIVRQPQRLVRQRHLADQRMVDPLHAVALVLHRVRGPEPPELLALDREITDQLRQLRIVRRAPRVHPQHAHHLGRLALPVHVEIRGVGVEEDHPGHVAVLRGQGREVAEQRSGRAVPAQDVQPPPHHVGGHALHGVHQLLHGRAQLLRPAHPPVLLLLRLREMAQVVALGVRQPQSPPDRVQHLGGHIAPVALFQAGVVRHRHPRELRQLLATEPRYPPATAQLRQADVLGLQPGAA